MDAATLDRDQNRGHLCVNAGGSAASFHQKTTPAAGSSGEVQGDSEEGAGVGEAACGDTTKPVEHGPEVFSS